MLKNSKNPLLLLLAAFLLLAVIHFALLSSFPSSVADNEESPSQPSIPKAVHLSVASNATSLESWYHLNPGYTIFLYDDVAKAQFITQEYPEFLTLYQSLYTPEQKAALWRLLIIHSQGGFCFDLGWVPSLAVHAWQKLAEEDLPQLEPVQVLFGRASLEKSQFNFDILHWGFAAVPNHSVFYDTARYIREQFIDALLVSRKLGGECTQVFRTGTEFLTRTVYRHLQKRGADLSKLKSNSSFYYEGCLIGTSIFDGSRGINYSTAREPDLGEAKSAFNPKFWTGEVVLPL